LVHVGFEPKLVFLCPLCSKEVEIIYGKGKREWSSDHVGCVNFSVIRTLPQFGRFDPDGPVVFVNLESDFSIKEAAEGLRILMKEEGDQGKNAKLEAGVRRLESKLGSSEKLVKRSVSILKSGAFGIKAVSGRGVSALVWKDGERYLGFAMGELAERSAMACLASDSAEEGERFFSHWIHYWEQGRLP
jgi:hypothetical protein